jgi:hypothetical protein
VSLVMARSEMGQGVHTALAMLVAEELRLPLARVQLEAPDGNSRYGNVSASVDSVLYFSPEDSEPGAESRALRASRWLLAKAVRELGINATGGSSSITDLYPVLREAAATARAQLLGAASLQWKLPVAELQMADGVVSHPSGPRAPWPTWRARPPPRQPATVSLTPPSRGPCWARRRHAPTPGPRSTAVPASASTSASPGRSTLPSHTARRSGPARARWTSTPCCAGPACCGWCACHRWPARRRRWRWWPVAAGPRCRRRAR